MLMPKKDRIAIYEYLFKEGVMVAKKDTHAPKHPELETVCNLHVIKALQSLKSRGYVKEQFAWRHYYWYLTNEGIEYLRNFLNLPPEIVPSTLKKQTRIDTARPRPKMPTEQSPKSSQDRSDYRRATDKKGDVGMGANQNVDFRGSYPAAGYGRGRPHYLGSAEESNPLLVIILEPQNSLHILDEKAEEEEEAEDLADFCFEPPHEIQVPERQLRARQVRSQPGRPKSPYVVAHEEALTVKSVGEFFKLETNALKNFPSKRRRQTESFEAFPVIMRRCMVLFCVKIVSILCSIVLPSDPEGLQTAIVHELVNGQSIEKKAVDVLVEMQEALPLVSRQRQARY
ncbi:40S ribosomal protein S10 [Nymphon striatum]|nr:40S ribosomal protein S10 [Nymphon striatum]